jgi:hypothetical protein
MELIIDADLINVIIAAGVPLIGLIIDYIKRKLSNNQGDVAFNHLLSIATQVKNLAIVFPQIAPLAEEFYETVENAKKLWDDPTNNTDALMEAVEHGEKLFAEIMKLISEFVPKTVVV